MAVEHQDSHTVAAHYTKRCQSTSKCIGAQVKLFPGIASLSTSNCLTGSRSLFCMCQSLCDVHIEPSLLYQANSAAFCFIVSYFLGNEKRYVTEIHSSLFCGPAARFEVRICAGITRCTAGYTDHLYPYSFV